MSRTNTGKCQVAPSGGLKPSDWSDVDGAVNGRRPRPVKREEPRRHTVTGGDNVKNKVPTPNMDLERYNRNRKLTKSSSESGDPKKDLILGHLQRRFPDYASTIAGHGKEQFVMPTSGDLRDWTRVQVVHGHLYQRGHSMYQPPSSVYDDDPGIMSEVETSATGFRRGGKQRSSLPVVRTPNKTLERPLGLVFLQYRSETKRALLPNEITSLDTVKALFVRSFPKQLTMEYLDSPHIRIYIHDPSKDMFYELEDLRDIRDRSVLRIYEQDVNGGGAVSSWDQDLSYFSEPEFDSEYQHQHIHRAKKGAPTPAGSGYYGTMTHSYPPSLSVAHTATLPRTGGQMRPFSPSPSMLEKQKSQTLPPSGAVQPPPKPQRTYQQPVTSMAKSVRATPPPQGPPPPAPSSRTNQTGMSERHHHATHESGYHSSPERRVDHHRSFPTYLTPSSSYEDPYYGDRTYGSRSGSVTPIIDEEARLRMQMMERQLANLTGLVHKALTTSRQSSLSRDIEVNFSREHVQLPPTTTSTPTPATRDTTTTTAYRSDDITTETKPQTLASTGALQPDEYRAEPKPVLRQSSKEVQLTPEMYNQLRLLKKKTKDLRSEVRNLRRMSQAQALNIKETIRETSLKIKAVLATAQIGNEQIHSERVRVSREEELYTQDVQQLEKDLSELEAAVEDLRSNVINRRCRVNMSDVESMALVLSKSSKMVADLKGRFPNLHESLKAVMAAEMEVVVQEEKFLKEEPERLENALRRCKKLTGTLVTLKRLASVQEQRLPPSGSGPLSPALSGEHKEHTLPHGGSLDAQMSKAASFSGELKADGQQRSQKSENALDALLDELQTFAKPTDRIPETATPATTGGTGKRSTSHSNTESPVKNQAQVSTGSVTTTTISKLQVSEAGSKQSINISPTPSPIPPENKNQDLLAKVSVGGLRQSLIEGSDAATTDKTLATSPITGVAKKVPPPPPPRTSSKSPLMSPTSPLSPTSKYTGSGTLPRSSNLQATVLARVSSLEPTVSHLRTNTEPITNGNDNVPSRSSIVDITKKDPTLVLRTSAISDENLRREQLSSNSSSSESVNSQEGVQMRSSHGSENQHKGSNNSRISMGALSDSETIKKTPPTPPARNRQEILEQRHQELLRKQKQLQEQYARLQQLQRGQTLQRFSPPRSPADLKKTGSESNILLKAGLTLTPVSGSLTHLAPISKAITPSNSFIATSSSVATPAITTTTTGSQITNKIYETDIL